MGSPVPPKTRPRMLGECFTWRGWPRKRVVALVDRPLVPEKTWSETSLPSALMTLARDFAPDSSSTRARSPRRVTGPVGVRASVTETFMMSPTISRTRE